MPVTVTVEEPVAAVLDAASVRVLVPVVEAGEKLAVTPLGKPLALNATLPVNPPASETVIVLWPLAPCAMLRLVGEADRLKSGVEPPPVSEN